MLCSVYTECVSPPLIPPFSCGLGCVLAPGCMLGCKPRQMLPLVNEYHGSTLFLSLPLQP